MTLQSELGLLFPKPYFTFLFENQVSMLTFQGHLRISHLRHKQIKLSPAPLGDTI